MTSLDVVVTGIGVICATGSDSDAFLVALRHGTVGVRATSLDGSDRSWMAGRITEAYDEPPPVWAGLEMTAHERLAIVAAREALRTAELGHEDLRNRTVGVYVGACQGGLSVHEAAVARRSETGDGAARHGLNSIADAVAIALGVRGPRTVTSNACSASASAIAAAAEELAAGRTDVALAGGADALERFTLEGFGSLASLDPSGCSPYHRSAGLVVGEGAGFVVLERGSAARDRGAPLRGRLLGWGASADAYHPTAPDPTGRGAATAIHRALAAAGCRPAEIDYINGHGTGTPANDTMELRAFTAVFGSCTPPPPVSSTKSMIGHTLGAASVIESVASLLGMEHGFIPPTTSGGAEPLAPAGGGGTDVVTDEARPTAVRRAVKTSYAFGGANYALVWGRADQAAPPGSHERPKRAVVTGLGVLGPAGTHTEQWAAALARGDSVLRPMPVRSPNGDRRPVLLGLCPDLEGRGPASANAWRRMDRLSRRCVVAAHDALRDAGFDSRDSLAEVRDSLMILLATSSGPVSTLLSYRDRLVQSDQRGMAALFPNTALNAAAGHIAATMGVRGGIASFTSGGLTSDAALRHAADLVQHGRCERVLVVAAEELTREFVEFVVESRVVPLATSRLSPFDPSGSGTALSEAIVCLMVEQEEAAAERGIRPYGRYLGSGVATADQVPTIDAWQDAVAEAMDSTIRPDVVFAAASGLGERDEAEKKVLDAIGAEGTRICPLKGVLGEALGASGAVGAAAALLGFSERPAHLGSLSNYALVNSVSMSGQCWVTAWGAPGERRTL